MLSTQPDLIPTKVSTFAEWQNIQLCRIVWPAWVLAVVTFSIAALIDYLGNNVRLFSPTVTVIFAINVCLIGLGAYFYGHKYPHLILVTTYFATTLPFNSLQAGGRFAIGEPNELPLASWSATLFLVAMLAPELGWKVQFWLHAAKFAHFGVLSYWYGTLPTFEQNSELYGTIYLLCFMFASALYMVYRLNQFRKEQFEALLSAETSNLRFKSLYERAAEAIFRMKPDGTILSANPAAIRIFGYDQDSEAGFNLARHQDEIKGEYDALIEKVIDKGAVNNLVVNSQSLNGSSRWFLVNAHVSTLENGETVIDGFATDITDREEARRTAALSQKMLQSVVNKLPQHVYWKDVNRSYVGFNQQFASIAALHEIEDLSGKQDDSLPWQESIQFIQQIEEQVLKTGEPVLHQLVENSDLFGRHSWLGLNYIPLKNEAGEVDGVLGMISDVTHRKQLQLAEKQRDAQQRVILKAIPDGVVRFSKNGVCLETISTQQERAEAVGQFYAGLHLTAVLPRQLALDLSEAIVLTIEENKIQITEYTFENQTRFEFRVVPSIENEAVVLIRDITARWLAKEELMRRDDILEGLAYSTEQLVHSNSWREYARVVLEKIATVTNCPRVLLASIQDEEGEIYAVLENLWTDNNDASLFHAGDREGAIPLLASGFGAWVEALRAGEHIISWRDNSPQELKDFYEIMGIESIAIVPIFVAGNWWGYFGLNNLDESRLYGKNIIGAIKAAGASIGIAIERHQTQRALMQTQKLESIGLLAGGIAHDFNNLLTGMLGQSSIAMAKLSAADPARRHIEKAVISAERAADLTKQLLAYAGKGQFQIVALDVNQIIRENTAILETVLPADVELVLNLDPTLASVEADRGQMQQLIMNLVINAGDAMRQGGGVLWLKTQVVDIGTDRTDIRFIGNETLSFGRYIKLVVRDSGIGMDESTLKQIFDPYFTTKTAGQGLGLSATLGIIRAHGGGLLVDSEVGIGTKFSIYLPAIEQEIEAQSTPAFEGLKKNKAVLVIDDQASVRDVVEDVLSLEDYQVFSAENGLDGIESYKKYQAEIGLILLDMKMPGLSGPETYQKLAEINPEVPVVVSTGFSETDAMKQFENANIRAYLIKPYDIVKLVTTIQAAMQDEVITD